jgi:hypothetical protein
MTDEEKRWLAGIHYPKTCRTTFMVDMITTLLLYSIYPFEDTFANRLLFPH